MLHSLVHVCLFLIVFLAEPNKSTTNKADAFIIIPHLALSTKALYVPQKRGSASCSLNLNVNKLESLLIGGIFGKEEKPRQEDPVKVLGTWENLEQAEQWQDILAARSSLQNFLQLWARRLEEDKGLATPITGTDFHQEPKHQNQMTKAQQEKEAVLSSDDDDMVDERTKAMPRSKGDPSILTESIGEITSSSMKLKFRPPKRYLSFKEQRGLEKGVLPDRKGAKVDAWSPGGVELCIVITQQPQQQQQQQQQQDSSGHQMLALTARRCDIDGDTIIKFSSERAIIRRLEEALRIWKKVRAMPMK